MPKVVFVDEGNLTVEAKPEEPLMDLCQRAGATIIFGCGAGVCGTCMINVLEGKENLSPPTDQEKDALTMFNAKPNQRLACQCNVLGDVKIEKSHDL
jgi:ferredoxin